VTSIVRFPSAAVSRGQEDPPQDESDLVQAVLRGDRDAAERLVEITYGTIYASLYKLCGDGDLASDLTQETYRRAWAALGGFGGRSKFSTWLYRIAYTTFLNHVRRPARVVAMDEKTEKTTADDSAPADELLEAREESEALRRAVIGLPEELRLTVTAHFWGGLDVAEIARMESITGAGVRKRLRKAFALLAVALDEELT
jgi:RNA polymerase sigma factor (sigma-70 family)